MVSLGPPEGNTLSQACLKGFSRKRRAGQAFQGRKENLPGSANQRPKARERLGVVSGEPV